MSVYAWRCDFLKAYLMAVFVFFRICPSGYTCLKDIGENPRFGYVGFDHFGWSMLTSFQLITLDFWEDTYNKVSLNYLKINTLEKRLVCNIWFQGYKTFFM